MTAQRSRPYAVLRRLGAEPRAAVALMRRTPALARLQLAWAATITATWIATITVTVAAYELGGAGAVATVVLARTLPTAAFGTLAVSLVANRSRAVILRAASVAAAAACAASTGALELGAGALAALAGLALVVNVAGMVFRTALASLSPENAPDPRALAASNVLISATESAGVFVGPAVAGILLAVAGPAPAFLVAALMFAAAIAPLGATTDPRPRARRARPARGDALAAQARVLRHPVARLLFAATLAQTVVSGALAVLYAALALDVLDMGEAGVGTLTAAFGVGGVVGSLAIFGLAGSSHLGRAAGVALVLWGAPLALLAAAAHPIPALALLGVAGAGNVLFDVTVITTLQRGVTREALPAALGALETVVVIGLGAGAALAVPLIAVAGPVGATALLGGGLALVGVALVPALSRLDRSLEAPAAGVALLRGLDTFRLLPVVELERLALALGERRHAAGATLIHQGETGDWFGIVVDGEVEVHVDGRHVNLLRAGDSFGEIALLRDGVRTATAIARTPVTLRILERDAFLAAMADDDVRRAAGAQADARLAAARPGRPPDPGG